MIQRISPFSWRQKSKVALNDVSQLSSRNISHIKEISNDFFLSYGRNTSSVQIHSFHWWNAGRTS